MMNATRGYDQRPQERLWLCRITPTRLVSSVGVSRNDDTGHANVNVNPTIRPDRVSISCATHPRGRATLLYSTPHHDTTRCATHRHARPRHAASIRSKMIEVSTFKSSTPGRRALPSPAPCPLPSTAHHYTFLPCTRLPSTAHRSTFLPCTRLPCPPLASPARPRSTGKTL